MPPDSHSSVLASDGRAEGAGLAPRTAPSRTPAVVALADTRWVGHHPTYFREFAASLRRLGARVIALCPEPDDLVPAEGVWAGKLDAPSRSLLAPSRFDNDPASTALRWWRTRRALEAAEDRTGWRTDFVFFPYLDNFLRFLPSRLAPDWLLGRAWSGLYFRNQHLGGSRGGVSTALRSLAKGDRLLRSSLALPLIGVLDERFDEALARRSGRQAIQFPDITDETRPSAPVEFAEKLRTLARGRPIIGLVGGLEKRKGLLTLLRIALAARERQDWFFAVVGPFFRETFSPSEQAFILESRRQLGEGLYLELNGSRIPDGAFYNSIFQTFDVAWAAYEDFQGSSNTLTKAALFEKPVLATTGECVGRRVEEFGLGLHFRQGDIAGGVASLQALMQRTEATAQSLAHGFSEYRRFHSRAQLDATFRRLLAAIRP